MFIAISAWKQQVEFIDLILHVRRPLWKQRPPAVCSLTAYQTLCRDCRNTVSPYEEGVNDQAKQFILNQFRIAQFRNDDMVCTVIQIPCYMI